MILGGGFAGVVTARRLRRLLGPAVEVTVLDRRPRFAFTPSFVRLISRERRASDLVRERSGLQADGIMVRTTEITGVELDQRRVVTRDGAIPWDYLAVTLGAEGDPEQVPGLARAALNLYSLDGPQQCADVLAGMTAGRVAVLVAGDTFKCPWAPYEAALVIDAVLRRRGARGRCAIDVYTPEAQPMQACGADASVRMAQLLRTRRISVHTRWRVAACDPGGREIRSADADRASYGLLVAVPPHRPPRVVATSGLASPAGWIHPLDGTLRTAVPRVYAAGDVTDLDLGAGLSLPKLGVAAHQAAEVLAANLAAEVRGGPPADRVTGRLTGLIATGISRAALWHGDFARPTGPASRLTAPSVLWHWGKAAFERRFLRTWL